MRPYEWETFTFDEEQELLWKRYSREYTGDETKECPNWCGDTLYDYLRVPYGYEGGSLNDGRGLGVWRRRRSTQHTNGPKSISTKVWII